MDTRCEFGYAWIGKFDANMFHISAKLLNSQQEFPKFKKIQKDSFLYSGKKNEFWQKICGSYKNKRLNHNRRVEADVSIYVM